MSSIVISGDTSGAITLAAPATAGSNTLTLPARTGTISTGMVHLGTLTMSGSTQSLTSLDLTGYSQLLLVWDGVTTGIGAVITLGTMNARNSNTNTMTGHLWVDLNNGVGTYTAPQATAGATGYTTATTTVTVATSGTTFSAGTIRVYGVA